MSGGEGMHKSIFRNPVVIAVACISSVTFTACGGGSGTSSSTVSAVEETCTGYGDWQTSSYVLPYASGVSFKVIQGNCAPAGNGHTGVNRYAYDFDMTIGTPFLAMRGGTVAEVEQSHFDGQVALTGLDNYIVIKHS